MSTDTELARAARRLRLAAARSPATQAVMDIYVDEMEAAHLSPERVLALWRTDNVLVADAFLKYVRAGEDDTVSPDDLKKRGFEVIPDGRWTKWVATLFMHDRKVAVRVSVATDGVTSLIKLDRFGDQTHLRDYDRVPEVFRLRLIFEAFDLPFPDPK